MARRRKKLTDEDKVLWKRVTSTVDPTQEPVGLVAASKKPEELYTRFVKLMSASKPIQAPKVKSPPPVPPRAQVVPKYNQTLDHKTRKKNRQRANTD